MAIPVSIENYKPLNRWGDWESIRPGVVGTVGDVLGAVRLKQSMPDLPMRWDNTFNIGSDQCRLGTNVQNGDSPNYYGFKGPRVMYGEIINRERVNTRGWSQKDIIPPAKVVEPVLLGLPQYSWKTQAASVYKAKVPGTNFLPLPSAFELPPGQLPRGGNTPNTTNLTSTETSVELLQQLQTTLAPKPTYLNKGTVGFGPGQNQFRSSGMMSRK